MLEELAKKQAEANQCCSPQEQKIMKDFNSCGIEEKVLRLHATIKDLRRELTYSYHSNSAMETKIYALEHHQHSEKGDCMIRIEDSNRNSNGISGMGNISNAHDLLA